MLPPPAQLQPVVNDITEWLAMLASGTNEKPSRTWSPTEWRYARVVAHIQGIAPLLHVRGAGTYGDDVWRAFLTQQYERNTQRNRRIKALFDDIEQAATQRSVPLMPLKGVSLITWLYDDIGLRPMSDIDLFTPAEHEDGVREVIEAIGFRMVERIERHRVFVLPPNTVVDLHGEHPDNPIKLELHTRLFDNVPREEIDLTPMFTRCCQCTPAERPTPADVLVHALLHATAHMMKRSLRFVTVHDLALLARRLTELEWNDVRDKLLRFGGAWWAYPPLRLMARYFSDVLPTTFQDWLSQSTTASLRRSVPRMTIADVSYCNLRPQYLDQLMLWSRTPRESLMYVVERLSGTGRMGWQTSHKWTTATHVFAPTKSAYRRLARWFSPRAYRAGVEQLFG